MKAAATVDILGVPIAAMDRQQVLDALVSAYRRGQRVTVSTPNPEIIDRSLRDSDFHQSLIQSDWLVADGIGVLWASRVFRTPLPGTVPGVDLMDDLLDYAASQGISVCFVGTTTSNLMRATNAAQHRHPTLLVAGAQQGFFPVEEMAQVAHTVESYRPGVVFVGMGAPRDQEFLRVWKGIAPTAGIALAVGGALDVLAGDVRRAPRWVRRLGLEWAYRLVSSPRRWSRQLALPRFVIQVLRRRLQ